MTSKTSTLVFFVNGKKVTDNAVDPEWTLLNYLRNKLKLCGTKLGCAEGGCGACTVMVSKYDRDADKITHIPVNACLAPICSVHGQAVTTVEGIGSTRSRLHPVQERIAKAHGSQCGFCTPGIVMSMYTLLRNSPKPNFKELEVAFQGNLCRCTGYRPILEGYKTFLEDWEVLQNGNKIPNGNGLKNGDACGMGKDCCKLKSPGDEEILFDKSEFVPYDSSQEPIFPPELKVNDVYDKQELFFKGKNVEWHRPKSLNSLLELKEKYPDAKIIVGNTEVGVEVKFKHCEYPVLIQPTKIEELTNIKIEQSGVKIGAAVTLQEMETVFKQQIELNQNKTKILKSIVEMLNWFAGKQIRSVAAVGGNIMTGSPISDLNPIFLAANAVLEVASKKNGVRKIIMNEKFFTGYRRNVIKPDEILVSILIPFNLPNQHFYAYKQARRRDDDIAIVNAAFNVFFEGNTKKIKDIYMAFGGMAPTTVLATKTRENLIGKEWNNDFVETGFNNLIEDLPLSHGAPGGMIQFRRSLTLSFFFRMYLQISHDLQLPVDPKDMSALKTFHTKQIKSSQYFQIIPSTQEKIDSVGRPIVHASAFKQACGEATYCDDIPHFENELYLAYVYSTKAYAEIVSIDPTEALRMDGVHHFFSANDMVGLHNKMGPVIHDEEVFVSKTVTAHGQIIAAVLADNQMIAQAAARKVKVEYRELQPVLISIEDAIKHKSYYNETPIMITSGDIEKGFKEAKHVVEGDCRTGGQEHFYFETQAVIALPKKEDNEMEIYCSTQHPTELCATLSEVLNIPQNKLTCKVKRIGGGFGGKESKACNIAIPVCVAAYKTQKPVRLMLDRDEDMVSTAGRHPFYMKYKVGFDDNGKLIAAEFECYSNAGCSADLSRAVMERAVLHIENSYKIPNLKVSGYCCKTNIHSNTAFRGFGGPQGMFCTETMIRAVAEYLNKDVIEVAELNLFNDGDLTHFNYKLDNCTVRRCWKECLENSNYNQRAIDVKTFNKENRYKKRGISVVPTMFGIAFTIPFLNQGGALVNIYTDGSVLITHGGIEMGQGLHTKMLQVASRVLGIPVSKIHITETSTDKVPNTSPTAASTGSDINGMAVMRACETLMERLKPIIAANPKDTWEEWIKKAYLSRISLSSTGFYGTDGIGYDWNTNSGNIFNYVTTGVCCTEVEVDCLTGDHQVLRSDIVMDLGESLNPAIDIGQIEGAFMQGYGLFVLEEVVYLSNGAPFTRGPGAYKIPGFGDIPAEFNVALLKGASNPRAVYSSKAVGEPPLFLASSALFAAREAIKDARRDAGCSTIPFKLDAPATAAKLRMACQDTITAKFQEPVEGTYTPWNIIP
nr:xanthine dehydrogenase [Onthophagus taurus]